MENINDITFNKDNDFFKKYLRIIKDEKKYLTANNCASIPKNLIYSQEVKQKELFNYIIDCHGE